MARNAPKTHNINNLFLKNRCFSEQQLQEIKTIIKDTVRETSQDIAAEAAQAAKKAMQQNDSSNVLTSQEFANAPSASTAIDTASLSSTSLTPPSAVPNQDLPASCVKEIQTGEFFELSKLLPKHLSLYNDDDNLTLSLENSTIKVTTKIVAITDIEQWTTGFTTYMSVFTMKYPFRAQEFMLYLSLIRYAARMHKGLG